MIRFWQKIYAKNDNVKAYSLLLPALILVILAMASPMLLTVVTSFHTQVSMMEIDTTLTLDRYKDFFSKPVYTMLLVRSIKISFFVTLVTLITTYPLAYYIAFYVKKNKMLWIVLMTLPFWTSYLLRVFSWKVILGHKGVINSALMASGMINEPLSFLIYSQTAVVITLAHAWAAFAILPLYVSLDKIDKSLLEASYDLGNTKLETFWRVTFPLSLPGVIGAILIIFIPTVGDYVTPQLVGGTDGRMLSNMIQSLFGRANNFPLGAASAVLMLLSVSFVAVVVTYITRKVSLRMS
jgi:spermidine/putrescine transport system permease protein